MSKQLEKLSKFLSLVLRHKPDEIGLELDCHGWAIIDDLIIASCRKGIEFDRDTLMTVVHQSDKKRFAVSEDGARIRANQGHSVNVDLNLQPKIPPNVLLHGTATRFLDSILDTGLSKMERHHVHLTESKASAIQVGSRYGKAVLLQIDAKAMSEQGHVFYKTDNGVWLVEFVDPIFISII